MLARYLRQGDVQRYAIVPPDTVRNYLSIVPRAYSVPRVASHVLPTLEPNPGSLHGLMHSVLHEGEHDAIPMALDRLSELADVPIPHLPGGASEDTSPEYLIDLLLGMHHALRDAPSGRGILLGNLSTNFLQSGAPRRSLIDAYFNPNLQPAPGNVPVRPSLDVLVANLTRHPASAVGGTHVLDELDELYNTPLPEGDYKAFVRLYDLAHQIAQRRGVSPHPALRLAQRTRDSAANVLYELASRFV